MKIFPTIAVTFVTMVLSSFAVEGFVVGSGVSSPSATTFITNNRSYDGSNHVLYFHQKEESSENNNRPHPSFKVTKLQHSTIPLDKTSPLSKRRSLVSQVQQKAVNLLLSTYELDRMEYGV